MKAIKSIILWPLILLSIVYLVVLGIIAVKYSGKAFILFAMGFPFVIFLVLGLIVIILTYSRKSSSVSETETSTESKPSKSSDSKDKSKDTSTKTLVTEKRITSSEQGWLTPVRKLFGLLFILLMISIVIFYFIGSGPLKDMANGNGVGGAWHIFWAGLTKKNVDSTQAAYNMKKLDNKLIVDTMSIGVIERNSRRVKRTGLFGTVYEEDDQQVQQSENNNSDNQKTPDNNQASNTGLQVPKQQFIGNQNAIEIGESTLTQ